MPTLDRDAYATRDAALVAAVVTALAVALHARGWPGSFLSDDFGHLFTIATLDREGRLGAWLAERFVDSLHNGNFAYRPVLFISYAIDWRLFGPSAAAMHAENLALHVVNAALVGVLAARWAGVDRALAGAFAAAAFVAYPFAGEVSFWIVGRANLLATLFGLLFLVSLAAAPARASLARHAVRVACVGASLLANESAMPLVGLATIAYVVAPPAAIGDVPPRSRFELAARELAPCWLALAAYVGVRFALFGTLRVYDFPFAKTPRAWIDRGSDLVESLGRQVAIDPPFAWPLAFALLVVALAALAWRAPGPRTRVLAFALVALAYVASAIGAVPPAAHGEGVRNYYMAWTFMACAIGFAATPSSSARVVALALVGWLLVGQEGSLRQWQSAAASMRALTAAVPRFAATIEPRQLGAVMVPSRIGAALFARNAQQAIFLPPVQREDYGRRLVGMTEWDIDKWPGLLAAGSLAELHGAPLPIGDFAGAFCFAPGTSAFVRIAPPGVLPDARWGGALRANARDAGCLPML